MAANRETLIGANYSTDYATIGENAGPTISQAVGDFSSEVDQLTSADNETVVLAALRDIQNRHRETLIGLLAGKEVVSKLDKLHAKQKRDVEKYFEEQRKNRSIDLIRHLFPNKYPDKKEAGPASALEASSAPEREQEKPPFDLVSCRITSDGPVRADQLFTSKLGTNIDITYEDEKDQYGRLTGKKALSATFNPMDKNACDTLMELYRAKNIKPTKVQLGGSTYSGDLYALTVRNDSYLRAAAKRMFFNAKFGGFKDDSSGINRVTLMTKLGLPLNKLGVAGEIVNKYNLAKMCKRADAAAKEAAQQHAKQATANAPLSTRDKKYKEEYDREYKRVFSEKQQGSVRELKNKLMCAIAGVETIGEIPAEELKETELKAIDASETVMGKKALQTCDNNAFGDIQSSTFSDLVLNTKELKEEAQLQLHRQGAQVAKNTTAVLKNEFDATHNENEVEQEYVQPIFARPGSSR